MRANGNVVSELARIFTETEDAALPLAERLVRCLEAAQAVGGDKRGKQSAALLNLLLRSYIQGETLTRYHQIQKVEQEQFHSDRACQ